MNASQVVVYVIDAAIRPVDSINFERSVTTFKYFCQIHNEAKTVLFILDKQELVVKNPIGVNEFIALYEFTTTFDVSKPGEINSVCTR